MICAVAVVNGCNPIVVPLQGKYNHNPGEIVTTKSIDSVWSDLSDIFTRNGLPIKNIDKHKGLIRTRKTSPNSIYTFENKDGQLEQPQAWVVLMKDFIKEKQWNPKTIYSEWNVKVTETGKGITTIKIDPVVICNYYPNSFTKVESRGQSTGKLEEMLADHFKLE